MRHCHRCLLSSAGDATRGGSGSERASGRSPARRGKGASAGGGGWWLGARGGTGGCGKQQGRAAVGGGQRCSGHVRVGSGWRVRARRGGCSTKLHRHTPVVRACRSHVASRRSSLCRRSDVLLSCCHRTGGRAARRGRRRAKAGGCTWVDKWESKLPEACRRRFWIWPSCFFAASTFFS